MTLRSTLAVAAVLLVPVGQPAAASHVNELADVHDLARGIFKQLVEIPTSESREGSTPAAKAMAQRLIDGGFPAEDVQVLGPNERKQNLVARLRGKGKAKPVLLIGHLDVVEARREDWSTDPFQFIEKDGYFYGRGTQDMKDGVSVMVTTLLRYQREKFKPDRDIILALTADEEGGDSNGVAWLLKNHRDLVEAEFVLNHDGAGVLLQGGKAQQIELTATEKVYADFDLSVTNPGGHSSVPRKENAIYSLVGALDRVAKYDFPFELNNVTRAYFDRISHIAPEPRASDLRAILKTPPDAAALARESKDPLDNASIRTTCVATRLSAGHANNALPQLARATVNCRILPGHSPEEVRKELVKIVGDSNVAVRYINGVTGSLDETAPGVRGFSPPPLRPEVLRPLEKLAAKLWPGAPVIPSMSVGATDGVHTSAAGLPTYVVSGMALERDDIRAHGKDERIGINSFYQAVDFYYDYLKAVVSYK
jgi:acetylornithine deacetylase/succinyl-diaminopimelate desuccinylase-like protein